jgi:hypothetical protein
MISPILKFFFLTSILAMHLPTEIAEENLENFQKGYNLCILEALRFLSAHNMTDEMKILLQSCQQCTGKENLINQILEATFNQRLLMINQESKLDESVTVNGRPVKNVEILRKIRQKILDRKQKRHPFMRRKGHAEPMDGMWRPW